MKINKLETIFGVILLTLGLASNSLAKEIISSRLPETLIVNEDYGTNNDVEVKLTGIFSNGCFEKLNNEVLVTKNEIFIKNFVGFTPNIPCTMALKPYVSTIQLNSLDFGEYQIFVQNRFGDFKKISSLTIN